MKFTIDDQVFALLPDIVIAVPIIRGFDNTKGKSEAVNLLRTEEERLRGAMTLDNFWKDTRVTAYLTAFRKFGTDPEVRRPAHIALAKRVQEGGQLPDINPIVNIYNALSIKYLTPFGGENLDTVRGDFRLFVAEGGEVWFPIGGDKPKPALKGELVWGDDLDLSTRALNWRQCDRTKMTEESKNGFFVMDGFVGVNDQIMEEAAAELVKTATNMLGGVATVYWLSVKQRETADIVI